MSSDFFPACLVFRVFHIKDSKFTVPTRYKLRMIPIKEELSSPSFAQAETSMGKGLFVAEEFKTYPLDTPHRYLELPLFKKKGASENNNVQVVSQQGETSAAEGDITRILDIHHSSDGEMIAVSAKSGSINLYSRKEQPDSQIIVPTLSNSSQNTVGESASTAKIKKSSIFVPEQKMAVKVRWIKDADQHLLAFLSTDPSETHTCFKNGRLMIMKHCLDEKTLKKEWMIQIKYPESPQNRAVNDFELCFTCPSIIVSVSKGLMEVRQLRAAAGNRSTKPGHYLHLLSSLGLDDKLCPICVSWSKHLTSKYHFLAVGFKQLENSCTNNFNSTDFRCDNLNTHNTLLFVCCDCKEDSWELSEISCPFVMRESVNDVQWAFCGGRSYNLLAVSAESGLKVYEVGETDAVSSQSDMQNNRNLAAGKKKSLKLLREIVLVCGQKCLKVSWSVLGNSLCVEQPDRVLVFSCVKRGVWVLHKKIQ